MSTIGTLINNVLGDAARTTKFDVAFQFTNPQMFPSPANVAVLVKSASFPTKSHSTIDFKYKGRSIPLRGQTKYSNTWECVFYMPADHSIKKGFEAWIDALDEQVFFNSKPTADEIKTRGLHNLYGYTKDIAIYQLDFSGKDQTARYILHNVFPIEIAPISLTSEGPGSVEELAVTFSYSHFTLENVKGSGGAFLEGLANSISGAIVDFGNEVLDALGGEIIDFVGTAADQLGIPTTLEGASQLGQKALNSIGIGGNSDDIINDIVNGINPFYENGKTFTSTITDAIHAGGKALQGLIK